MGLAKKVALAVVLLLLIAVIGTFVSYILQWQPTEEMSVAIVVKGGVAGAAVSVYSLNDNGTKGRLLDGPVFSNDAGIAILHLPAKPETVLLVESAGGNYSDAAAGRQVELSGTDVMRAVLPAYRKAAVVTPFTHMASALAMAQMRKGVPAQEAANLSNIAVAQQYGMRTIIRILPVAADNPEDVATANRESREYGILLGGLAQLAENMEVRPLELADALARDWSDGILDGREAGNAITVRSKRGGTAMLTAATGLGDLQDAIDGFMASPAYAANLEEFKIALNPVSLDSRFFITVTNLPAWLDGEFGEFALPVAGGTPPYAWRLESGELPEGFELSPDGVISGTGYLPAGSVESISPPFLVSVTDSSTPWLTQKIELRIRVLQQPPEFMPYGITCQVGASCAASVGAVAGGTPPYYFIGYQSSKGPYPLGLSVGLDGTIKGKPSKAGTYAIEVCAVDLVGSEICGDVPVFVKEQQKQQAPPETEAQEGQVRNCVKSMTLSCSPDKQGAPMKTYVNNRYLGVCRGVTSAGACIK